MILSIVIPTLGRASEVRELLKSIELSKIENLSFEIVIVDQNFSNLLDPIVREFTQKGFLIKHFKVDFRGLSKAKNFGLKCAVGKYICFPDDDALFASNTITNAVGLLENNMYHVVCGKCIDVNGVDSVKKFSKSTSRKTPTPIPAIQAGVSAAACASPCTHGTENPIIRKAPCATCSLCGLIRFPSISPLASVTAAILISGKNKIKQSAIR